MTEFTPERVADLRRLAKAQHERVQPVELRPKTVLEMLTEIERLQARLKAAEKLVEIVEEVPAETDDDEWLDRLLVAAAAFREAR